MKHFVVYDKTTGDVLRSGYCADDDMVRQAREELDEGVMEATPDTTMVVSIDLEPLRQMLLAKVDSGAEATRQKFITPGYGQMQSYLAKAAEAEAWTANNAVPIPIIHAEAQALGKTDAALVAEVLLAKQQWTVGEALINATRLAAKAAVLAGTNLAEMNTAADVDWASVEATIRAAMG